VKHVTDRADGRAYCSPPLAALEKGGCRRAGDDQTEEQEPGRCKSGWELKEPAVHKINYFDCKKF